MYFNQIFKSSTSLQNENYELNETFEKGS